MMTRESTIKGSNPYLWNGGFVVLFRRRLTDSEKYLPGERIPMHQGGAEDLTFGSHNTLSIDFDAQRSVHTGIIAGI
jgi:hypothetical protein